MNIQRLNLTLADIEVSLITLLERRYDTVGGPRRPPASEPLMAGLMKAGFNRSNLKRSKKDTVQIRQANHLSKVQYNKFEPFIEVTVTQLQPYKVKGVRRVDMDRQGVEVNMPKIVKLLRSLGVTPE